MVDNMKCASVGSRKYLTMETIWCTMVESIKYGMVEDIKYALVVYILVFRGE